LTEPFHSGLSRKIPVSLQGTSIVRIGNGKITDWADYFDGLTSRRTALASYFKEWVEL
jgi:limonene-1,2-epoxide hydrolase